MKNDDNKIKDVKSTVNLISGAYTLPLIDKLFPNSQRIEDMEDIYFSITALVDTDRIAKQRQKSCIWASIRSWKRQRRKVWC